MQVRRLLRRLLERRGASRAQARLVAAQAGGDRAHIGNFSSAQAIDIGSAGTALIGRTLILRQGRAAEQREEQAERATLASAAGEGSETQRPRLHGGLSRIRLAQLVRLC